MKNKLTQFLFAGLIFLISQYEINAQAVILNDTAYYPESHPVEYDQVIYKTAPQIDEIAPQILENLALRVYYPADLQADEKRPMILLIHGGGFTSGSFTSFFTEAEDLARLGFVAVSIQYRLCKRTDCVLGAALNYPCNIAWLSSLLPSTYVATVDASDALKWLKLHAADYHIDPDNIILGGGSAGAITALHLAYMDQSEITEICTGCGTWPDYLADTLSPHTGVKGVFSMAGAILDTEWIDPSESNIDLFSVHGTYDGVVSYDSAPVYPCCNTYQIPIHGSCPTVSKQMNNGGNTYLVSGTGFGHDVLDEEWWEGVKEQILWFTAKSLFVDSDFNKHTKYVRSTPVPNCPNPLPPIVPSELCNLPLSSPGVVLFEEAPVATNTLEIIQNDQIRIYPNPASDQLFVDLSNLDQSLTKKLEVNIFNSLGINILNKIISLDYDGSANAILYTEDLSPGLYYLSLNSNRFTVWSSKVVLE